MKKRNLKYEANFRAYLFSMDFKTHKEICKYINVKPINNKSILIKKINKLYEKLTATFNDKKQFELLNKLLDLENKKVD